MPDAPNELHTVRVPFEATLERLITTHVECYGATRLAPGRLQPGVASNAPGHLYDTLPASPSSTTRGTGDWLFKNRARRHLQRRTPLRPAEAGARHSAGGTPPRDRARGLGASPGGSAIVVHHRVLACHRDSLA
jgi:hypothetical protein